MNTQNPPSVDAAALLERAREHYKKWPGLFADNCPPAPEFWTEFVASEIAALASPARVAEAEPVAWMHPTAGWTNAKRDVVARHCSIGGPQPMPLFPGHPQGKLWRHKKTGGTYVEIGRGRLQLTGEHDEAETVIYRSEKDGSLWTRLALEFEDGRFDRILQGGGAV